MFNDPGHAWLSVAITDLIALKIEHEISAYSYMNATRAFLEEDCDASIFLNAAKKAGWNVSVSEKYAEKTSIRSLPSFGMENLALFMNMKVDGVFYLYSSKTQEYDNKAKIVEIFGSKMFLEDVYGNRYRSTANNLVKCSSLTDTTPRPSIVRDIEEV